MKFLLSFLLLTSAAHARTIELSEHNTTILDRELDLITLDLFASALLFKRGALPPEQTMYVLVASPGGTAEVAYALKNLINLLPNVSVVCKFCASGAAYIFADTSQPKLAIKKSTAIMHEMYVPKCTARMVQERKGLMSLVTESLAFDKMMAKALSMPLKDYQDKINDKEWTLKGKELVDFKMADELVDITCTPIFKLMAPDTCTQ